MNIVSRTKEGRKWERNYKIAMKRMYELMELRKKSAEKFGAWECVCGMLNFSEEICCSECGWDGETPR